VVRSIVEGIEERGVLGECDGVLTGYFGSRDMGEAVADIVARVKTANPAAHYCCDPVIGNYDSGTFVRKGIPELIRDRAVPLADVVTPNQYELEFLSGRSTTTLSDVIAAADALHALGPRVVLVTSLAVADTPDDQVENLVSSPTGRFILRTPRVDIAANGAGDAMAALFFAHYLRTGSAQDALSMASSSVFGVLERTAEAGASEMLLVDAQEEFVKPSRKFAAEKLKG
jgi:pyridoxine kinase